MSYKSVCAAPESWHIRDKTPESVRQLDRVRQLEMRQQRCEVDLDELERQWREKAERELDAPGAGQIRRVRSTAADRSGQIEVTNRPGPRYRRPQRTVYASGGGGDKIAFAVCGDYQMLLFHLPVGVAAYAALVSKPGLCAAVSIDRGFCRFMGVRFSHRP